MLESAAKKKAKKIGAKAGKTAGKAAGKAAKMAASKIWFALASALGGPVAIIVIVVVVLLFCLPSMIFSSAVGMDSQHPDNESVIVQQDAAEWETNAEAALTARYNDLSSGLFWQDLATFFTTGKWGTAGETFKTEYANADELDENGNSISEIYFSSSNRLVAVINEAFRASLRDDKQAMKQAKAMAEASKPTYEDYVRNSPEYSRPSDVAEGDYHIEFTVQKDPNIEDQQFIYESCLLIAASSAQTSFDDAAVDKGYTGGEDNTVGYATSVKDALDTAFLITGLDWFGLGQKIVWQPSVTPSYSVEDEYETIGYRYYDGDGYEMTEAEVEEHPENVARIEPIEKRVRTVSIEINYSVALKSDYKDIIFENCGIEDKPADAPSYEISDKDLVQENAIQLTKFYSFAGGGGGSASIGDVGLPLPSGSYTIGSLFGWRTLYGRPDFHQGLDLPAAAGTSIYAVKDGVCSVKPYSSSYGNYVTIDHGNGLQTRYAHMSAILVADGQEVKAGDCIGLVGTTGNSTGNHLHLEVIQNGTRVDPLLTELGPKIREGARG